VGGDDGGKKSRCVTEDAALGMSGNWGGPEEHREILGTASLLKEEKGAAISELEEKRSITRKTYGKGLSST